jgi:prolyl-tRNA synthetase
MKMSQLFGKTSKSEGKDLTIQSHRLLVQAGFIRESTAGRYYLLPLGLKVHDQIIGVIRKHMNAAGAQEVIMPILHPLELWEETNRTTSVSFELMKVTDRRGAEFALGGTAEEMAVDLVRKFNISYKDLPFNIYQFSNKFRDEMRARGGLLRVREFMMKDAYSFSNEEQFKQIYADMRQAYVDIFEELGLKTDVVAADNGYIGGEYCHEFCVESKIGESRYFIDAKHGVAAHEDVAEFKIDDMNLDDELKPLEEVAAERGKTMEAGVELHKLPLWQQTKDVLYVDEGTDRYILVVIRGDLDVNETKLTHVANAWSLRAATDEEIVKDLGSIPGFISPVGFPKRGKQSKREVVIVGDSSLRTVKNMYGGANKKHRDLLNINIDRDFSVNIEADVALAGSNAKSPQGGEYIEKRGIEVGNIFQLGHHYSSLMRDAEFTNQAGEREKYYMGCYGIGVGRTMAAIAEVLSDDRGLVWPENIAPARVYLATIGADNKVTEAANSLYESLQKNGIEVLYDDRDVRPGEKFADADLIGIPYRVVISEKTIGTDQIEVKQRTGSEVELIKPADFVKQLVAAQ